MHESGLALEQFVFVHETDILTLLKVSALLSWSFSCSWVAYEKPGFSGHQYLLEEGEYKHWNDWGGYGGELRSLRPVLGVS